MFCGCAAVNRHHLGGDAVIRQLRRGYWRRCRGYLGITLAVMRLYGNFVAVIGNGLFSFKNFFVAAVVVDDVEGLLQEVVDVVDNYEVSRLVGEYVASYEGFCDGS